MRHRIFIAINLPERIKKRFLQYQERWPALPIKWVRDDNLHITLAFLGYLNDEEMLDTCKIARDVALKTSSFSITLNRVCYGPPAESKKMPRLVWVEGEKSEELGRLQKILENHLMNPSPPLAAGYPVADGTSSFGGFHPRPKGRGILAAEINTPENNNGLKSRPYTPHITLGRIRQWEFRKIEPEERPEINEEFRLDFPVDSIEVMESELKRGGPRYTVLESIPLGKI